MDSLSRIQGAVVGGWCGDAAGATLEFYRSPITERIARQALRMHGGGVFKVGPGQVTDDSELEMALLEALYQANIPIEERSVENFPIERIARAYIRWYNSNPFDIGNTTRNAFSRATNSSEVYDNSQYYNQATEANGGLMRCVPIAIWGRNLSNQDLRIIASRECNLSHASHLCCEINGHYLVGLAMLFRGAGPLEVLEEIRKEAQLPKVKDWVNEALSTFDITKFQCHRSIGHCRHAFQLTLHFLRIAAELLVYDTSPATPAVSTAERLTLSTFYEFAIVQTLLRAGDTDTNAKIVGAMIGAIVGIENIPVRMWEKVQAFRCHELKYGAKGHVRPEEYCVALAFEKLHAI
jgi:ADP-ribosyl-[dinitrogen reductase] hydrolase